VTRIGDAIHILKILIGDQNTVYKLGKNWQTRAWDPVFKTAGSTPNAAMILGLSSQKNLKINIDSKLY
jgi:hypothetical protein